METFPLAEQIGLNLDHNWQTKTFTNLFFNIMSNFMPNEMMKSRPPTPQIDKNLKLLLKRKDKHYHDYKNHGYREEDKATLEALRAECKESM